MDDLGDGCIGGEEGRRTGDEEEEEEDRSTRDEKQTRTPLKI